MIIGCLFGVAATLLLAFAHDDKWELFLATSIMGIGFGLAFSSMSSLIVGAVSPEQTGVASGMNANIRTIGGSIGAALMASIVTSHLESERAARGARLHDRFRVPGRGTACRRDRGHRHSGRAAVQRRSRGRARARRTGARGRRHRGRGQARMTAVAIDAVARPSRRDAVRNQQRVLTAARAALAEHGTDVTMELIALRAGVGVGTVYRNFATKDALIDELVRLIFDDLVAAARAALDRADGTGLEEFLLGVRAVSSSSTAGTRTCWSDARRLDCGAEVLRGHVGELLEQGQRFGRIGPEIRLGDIMTTIWALRGSRRHERSGRPAGLATVPRTAARRTTLARVAQRSAGSFDAPARADHPGSLTGRSLTRSDRPGRQVQLLRSDHSQ